MNELILVDSVGKRFHRTLSSAFRQGLRNFARKTLRLPADERLGKDEFWALRDISFIVQRGECLGVIGPNGAGKSTLLKLIRREYRTDAGRVLALGSIQSLLYSGNSLQPMLSGRENILIQCQQMGLSSREASAKLTEIIAFAELEDAIDAPVKTYSDGMYARLEFAITTSAPTDILLVDEVLAVGDIAFQIRALERLNQLKQQGTAIVFVSHSEMNVRYIADRCLLLFNGRQVAWGEPDALFRQYYETVGYRKQSLQSLDSDAQYFKDMTSSVTVLRIIGSDDDGGIMIRTGSALGLRIEYAADNVLTAGLIVHFWNPAGILVASIDSEPTQFRLNGIGHIVVDIPYMSLTPGHYRLAVGFRADGQWLAYRKQLLDLYVTQASMANYQGVVSLQAQFRVD